MSSSDLAPPLLSLSLFLSSSAKTNETKLPNIEEEEEQNTKRQKKSEEQPQNSSASFHHAHFNLDLGLVFPLGG
ncbi:hypothetical protein CMV_009913 [Castanea mollissima]|uniref:Uncharacterized protein n=1 Tax=Castanea mollissima TaxID=60419 RepID=A0A8J4RJW8_9ROSI|nr:hypothetical protein CMV_009913 [Castanea mollissima]